MYVCTINDGEKSKEYTHVLTVYNDMLTKTSENNI